MYNVYYNIGVVRLFDGFKTALDPQILVFLPINKMTQDIGKNKIVYPLI